MFFNLFNNLGSFKGYVNKNKKKKLNVFIIVYFDDILIYIINIGQNHLEAVL